MALNVSFKLKTFAINVLTERSYIQHLIFLQKFHIALGQSDLDFNFYFYLRTERLKKMRKRNREQYFADGRM